MQIKVVLFDFKQLLAKSHHQLHSSRKNTQQTAKHNKKLKRIVNFSIHSILKNTGIKPSVQQETKVSYLPSSTR